MPHLLYCKQQLNNLDKRIGYSICLENDWLKNVFGNKYSRFFIALGSISRKSILHQIQPSNKKIASQPHNF